MSKIKQAFEQLRAAFERMRAAFESGDLSHLYDASQHSHQLVKAAIGADLARQDYEMHHDD